MTSPPNQASRTHASSREPRDGTLGDCDPDRIGERYLVLGLLGRGGSASAYRVRDTATGRLMALKRLNPDERLRDVKAAVARFEREYHTLVQLTHPRIVQVYAYGLDEATPYYTMELVGGGDLKELSPLPWPEVCAAAYDVCSALSLLHSRRLIHRDVTPRNIRRTADGQAKLIDFGWLTPMGVAGQVAGTPPYVAPELVQTMTLDGRSDLFSLGATMYQALTGRVAFPARRFDQLRDMWRSCPVAPSRVVPGLPATVDKLVLSLLRIDAGSRPKTAAEVMDRLRPLLPRPPSEGLDAARALLSSPQVVARQAQVLRLRKQVMSAVARRGGGVVIAAAAGLGRTRMLDAFVLEANLMGALTIRAGARDAALGPRGVAAALVAQVHAAVPWHLDELVKRDAATYRVLVSAEPLPADQAEDGTPAGLADLVATEHDRLRLSAALRGYLLSVASQRPLAIAVDDMDQADEPSVALLATLTWEASAHHLAYAMTLSPGAMARAPAALAVIRRHAGNMGLSPLTLADVLALLSSVFGDVPNLHMLSRRLHPLCRGRPRDCMTLAQHLVDQGVVTYRDGAWSLPSELPPHLLPSTLEDVERNEIARLSPPARQVALLLALGILERLTRAQVMMLDGADAAAVDRALDELLAARIVVGSPEGYALRHSGLARWLTGLSSEPEQRACHDELARIYRRSAAHPVGVAYHWLSADRQVDGIAILIDNMSDARARTALAESGAAALGAARCAVTFDMALRAAERLGRPQHELQLLRMVLSGLSARGEDEGYYYRVADAWLGQLKRDSGYDDYRALDPELPPASRALLAWTMACERHQATDPEERCTDPAAAIHQLVVYAAFSLAVGHRVLDLKLLLTIPDLLEPFALLSPVAEVMHGQSWATCFKALGMNQQARDMLLAVHERLKDVSDQELAFVDKMRSAVVLSIARIDACMGRHTAFIEQLENDGYEPDDRASAHYILKVAALHRGEWESADHHRQQAELHALQQRAGSMIVTLDDELQAHAMARDLTGLRYVRTAIHGMAARHDGWLPVKRVADAVYYRLCDDLGQALAVAASARAHAPDERILSPWLIQAAIVEVAVLVELNRAEEALHLGMAMLAHCERREKHELAQHLSCAIALAEAKTGSFAAAFERVEAVIAEQRRLGISGLLLGCSYETGARIAIWAADACRFEAYLALTASEFRPGTSSVLGALYERLIEEARLSGNELMPAREPSFELEGGQALACWAWVTTALSGCDDRAARAERALGLLCHGERPLRGFLFLAHAGGLALAASNTTCADATGLHAFAAARFDAELSQGMDRTVTADEPADGRWRDADGTNYFSVLLSVELHEGTCNTGLAVLTGADGALQLMPHLATALARKLMQAGDVSPPMV